MDGAVARFRPGIRRIGIGSGRDFRAPGAALPGDRFRGRRGDRIAGESAPRDRLSRESKCIARA